MGKAKQGSFSNTAGEAIGGTLGGLLVGEGLLRLNTIRKNIKFTKKLTSDLGKLQTEGRRLGIQVTNPNIKDAGDALRSGQNIAMDLQSKGNKILSTGFSPVERENANAMRTQLVTNIKKVNKQRKIELEKLKNMNEGGGLSEEAAKNISKNISSLQEQIARTKGVIEDVGIGVKDLGDTPTAHFQCNPICVTQPHLPACVGCWEFVDEIISEAVQMSHMLPCPQDPQDCGSSLMCHVACMTMDGQ